MNTTYNSAYGRRTGGHLPPHLRPCTFLPKEQWKRIREITNPILSDAEWLMLKGRSTQINIIAEREREMERERERKKQRSNVRAIQRRKELEGKVMREQAEAEERAREKRERARLRLKRIEEEERELLARCKAKKAAVAKAEARLEERRNGPTQEEEEREIVAEYKAREAGREAEAKQQARRVQEAQDEDIRRSLQEDAVLTQDEREARETHENALAQQFCQTERVRALHSGLLLTEVMKGWGAQLDMKERIRERDMRDERKAEAKRKTQTASLEFKMNLWNDMEADMFREFQSIRDKVHNELKASQDKLEEERLTREERAFEKELQELSSRKKAMLKLIVTEQQKERKKVDPAMVEKLMSQDMAQNGKQSIASFSKQELEALKEGRRLQLVKQIEEKLIRDTQQRKEESDFEERLRRLELEEEIQFQQYAGLLIDKASMGNKRNAFPIYQAARQGIGGGCGPAMEPISRINKDFRNNDKEKRFLTSTVITQRPSYRIIRRKQAGAV